jgi:mycothiol synthase
MTRPSATVIEVDATHLVATTDPVGPGDTRAEARAHLVDDRWLISLSPQELAPDTATALLVALADHATARGHPVEWWVEAAEDADDELAAAAGLVRDRELYQMRRPLPLDEHATIAVRPFRQGHDEDAWLALNNAAFHWHEEQSGWDRARLDARMAEPWFDPAGFLLHERDHQLAGFCWTKEHRTTVPALGEIHVIAVHPDQHGQGLGRELTLAGLDHLADRGLPVAMLYVEATNGPAVALYRSLGFEVHHCDRRYRRGAGPQDQAVLTPKSDPTA